VRYRNGTAKNANTNSNRVRYRMRMERQKTEKGNTGGGAPDGNGNSASNVKKARTLYDAGLALYHGGDYDEALKKFEAVLVESQI